SPQALLTLETEIKFQGYISRQEEEVARISKQQSLKLPPDLNFDNMPGLTSEVKEILSQHRPQTLGQAGRLAGITPASLSVLAIHLKAKNVSI
ncbi:MAG: tRNA uridine-5-carboxymethylaminomethyl(34) synthesis enzyme MnmG, partial [Candidatus Adiutrix sp.]